MGSDREKRYKRRADRQAAGTGGDRSQLSREELEAELEATQARLEAEQRARLAERKTREASEVERSDTNVSTKGEWLSQVWSSPTFKIKSTVRSQKDRHQRYTPRSVKPWVDFVSDATGYDRDQPIRGVELIHGAFRRMVSQKEVCNNADAVLLMNYVLDYLRSSFDWAPRSSSRYHVSDTVRAESLLNSTPLGPGDADAISLLECLEPDLAVKKKGSILILPFEMKPVFAFRAEDTEATNVVDSHNDSGDINYLYYRACLHQLTGVHGELEGHYIEDAEDGNPKQNKKQRSNRVHQQGTRKSPRGTLPEGYFCQFQDNAALNLELNPKPYSFKGWSGKIACGVIDSQQVDIKMPDGYYRQFQHTAASNLQLDAKPYSKGWSGNIGRGVIDGQQVAIKIAPMHSEKAEALLKEVIAYELLQRYWGRFVPALVKYGTTVNGALLFIAVEFVHGLDMSKRSPSQAEWRAAEEALNAIHSCGLLHGDIHEGNIMIEEGGHVQFIDFGFSKLITNEAECSEEINQLKRLSQRKRTSQDVCDSK